ncbi:MAG: cupredoxin family copper-binding protein [Gemmatimonadales bacterium]
MTRALSLTTLLLLALAPAARAQAVVDRTPNLDDGWTAPTGVIQFNFLHRFEVSPPPFRKVTSFPNFRLATGLPYGFNVDLDYATNSTVFTGIPNEYQLALRRPLLRESQGAPLDVTATAGYAFAPQSLDGEIGLARRFGRLRLLGTVRGISDGYDVQRSLWGVGTGAVVRVTSWLSLAGDVFGLVNAPDGAGLGTAWGAGAQLRIPYSPHTFSIQVTNTQSASIEGSSRGVKGGHMAGFEFTIPFTLSRYFGQHAKARTPGAAPDSSAATGSAAVVRVANLAFSQASLHVRVGTRVRWDNTDQLQHSVTADDGAFDSGLIEPGRSYERMFDRPGEYSYHCTPHPFMRARVIVEP